MSERARCGAHARRSGAPCGNRALPGSRYCLVHLERMPLFVGAALGAILSLICAEIWHTVVPSSELRELQQLNTAIQPILKIARERSPEATDPDALRDLAQEVPLTSNTAGTAYNDESTELGPGTQPGRHCVEWNRGGSYFEQSQGVQTHVVSLHSSAHFRQQKILPRSSTFLSGSTLQAQLGRAHFI